MAARMGRPRTIVLVLGWGAVAFSVVLLAVFAAIRVVHLGREPAQLDAFGVRYLQHPGIALLHVVPGALYVLLGPLQFVARIRARAITLHRAFGLTQQQAGERLGVSVGTVANWEKGYTKTASPVHATAVALLGYDQAASAAKLA